MYQTTKEQCQNNIDAYGHVCNYCGSKLEPIETTDNAHNSTFWTGCLTCKHYTDGCKPEIYSIAKRMVEEHNFYYFKSEGTWDDENTKRSNINKATSLIQLIEYLKANL